MNTNVLLAKTFIRALKTRATNFKGEFVNLVTETLYDPILAAKETELAELIETNRQIASLRDKKVLLVAATRPAVTLDANGNPVKRGRGRPRKNPFQVADPAPESKPAKIKKTASVTPVVADEI